MFPHRPVGRPGFLVSSVQCSPASVDLKSPLPAPPDTSVQGRRPACHRPAYSTFGLVGSRIRTAAPVEPLRDRNLFQVLPPAVGLQSPRSGFGPHAWRDAAAYPETGVA